MLAKLVLVGGRANRSELAVKTPALLGRSDDANLVLRHPMISRRQCELLERDGRLVLRDLGSRNGTLLNDQPTSESTVEPGDRITIGPLIFEVQYDLAVKVTTAADVAPLAAAQSAVTEPVSADPAEDVVLFDDAPLIDDAPRVEDVPLTEDVAPAEDGELSEEVALREDDAADLLESDMFDLVEDDVAEGDVAEGDAAIVADDDLADLLDEDLRAETDAPAMTTATPPPDDIAELPPETAADAQRGEKPVGDKLGSDESGSAVMDIEELRVDDMQLVGGGDFLEADIVDADLLDLVETAPVDSEPMAEDQPTAEPQPPADDDIEQSTDAPGANSADENGADEVMPFDAAADPSEPFGDLGDTICDPLDEVELLANSITPAPDVALDDLEDKNVNDASVDAANVEADDVEPIADEPDLDDLSPEESFEPAEPLDPVESGGEKVVAFELDRPADDASPSAEVPVDGLAAESVAASDDEFEDIFAEDAGGEGETGMDIAKLVDPGGVEVESVDSLDEMITSSDELTADGAFEPFGESDSDVEDLNLDDLSSAPEATSLVDDLSSLDAHLSGDAAAEVPAADATLADIALPAVAVPAVDVNGKEVSSTADARSTKKKLSLGIWPFGRKAKKAAVGTDVVAATASDDGVGRYVAVEAIVLDLDSGESAPAVASLETIEAGGVDFGDAEMVSAVDLDDVGSADAASGDDATIKFEEPTFEEPEFESVALEEVAFDEAPAAWEESSLDALEAQSDADVGDTDVEDAAEIDFAAFDLEPELDLEAPAQNEAANLADLDETVSADAPLDLDATIDAPAMFEQEVVPAQEVVSEPKVDDLLPSTVAADDELVLEDLDPAGDADLVVDAIVLGDEVVFKQEVEAPPISAPGRDEADRLGSSLFEDDQALEATLARNSDVDTAALEATAVELATAKKPKRGGSLLSKLLGRGKKKKPADPVPAATATPDSGAPEVAAAEAVVPDAEAGERIALPADTFEPIVDTPADDLELPTGDTPTVAATTSDAGDDVFLDFLDESDAEGSPAAPSDAASEDSAEQKDDGFDDLFKDL